MELSQVMSPKFLRYTMERQTLPSSSRVPKSVFSTESPLGEAHFKSSCLELGDLNIYI